MKIDQFASNLRKISHGQQVPGPPPGSSIHKGAFYELRLRPISFFCVGNVTCTSYYIIDTPVISSRYVSAISGLSGLIQDIRQISYKTMPSTLSMTELGASKGKAKTGGKRGTACGSVAPLVVVWWR